MAILEYHDEPEQDAYGVRCCRSRRPLSPTRRKANVGSTSLGSLSGATPCSTTALRPGSPDNNDVISPTRRSEQVGAGALVGLTAC